MRTFTVGRGVGIIDGVCVGGFDGELDGATVGDKVVGTSDGGPDNVKVGFQD